MAPRERPDQLRAAGARERLAGTPPRRRPARGRRLAAPPRTGRVRRVLEPRRRARRARGPRAGRRRLADPGAGRGGRRRLDRPRPPLRGPPDPGRQAGPGGPAVDVRRGPGRGGDARDRPRRCAHGAARHAPPHAVRGPAGRGALDDPGQSRRDAADRALRDERVAGPPGRRLAAGHPERGLGARASRPGPPAGPRPAIGGQPAGRVGPRAQPVPRLAPGAHDRGGRRGARPEPGVLGQLPGRGGGGAAADGAAADRHPPRDVLVAAGAGRHVHHARGRPRLVRRWPGRPQRGVPRAVRIPARPRAVARPAPPGGAQQLGGHLLRLRPRPAGRHGRQGQGPGRRAVRARRRLVRPP